MNHWIMLITSLPTENATARMRAWRNLKASGAAVLRDGVYLMPERDAYRITFEAVAADILASGGSALVLRVEEPVGRSFANLFDRTEDYAALLTEIAKVQETLTADSVAETLKKARKLRKAFTGLSDIDFFPGEARRQVEAALQALELAASRALSPDEPHSIQRAVQRLDITQYHGRTWATRRRPWMDRLASAWLIRRFIDREALFLWLATPGDCPSEVLGFDFDGAAFTHVGNCVTFEVLAASFGFDADPAIARIGSIVHYLDAGGVPVAEALGVEAVLAGLREITTDDDQLSSEAGRIFDGLYQNYPQENPHER
jgi:hypothetical protein